MNSAVITIRTPLAIKTKAQQTAKALGVNLSKEEKKELKLTKWAVAQLKKSEEDVKAGRVISFKTGEDEFAFIDKMIADDKRKHAKSK